MQTKKIILGVAFAVLFAAPLSQALTGEYGAGTYGGGAYGAGSPAATPNNGHSSGGGGGGGGGGATILPKPIPAKAQDAIPAKSPANNEKPATVNAPKKLFDIALTLADAAIGDISELRAITTFTSFGNAPTPVDLTYTIRDDAGNAVHAEKGAVTVEIENTVRKDFTGLHLPDGKYTLVLTTIYNGNVTDDFKQAFEIQSASSQNTRWLFLLLLGVILISAGLLVWKRFARAAAKAKRRP